VSGRRAEGHEALACDVVAALDAAAGLPTPVPDAGSASLEARRGLETALRTGMGFRFAPLLGGRDRPRTLVQMPQRSPPA
jgi:hypothetical protein